MRGWLTLAGLTAGVLCLFWPVITHAIEIWSGDEQLSFAFLVPPLLAGLLWWRRESLRELASPAGVRAGLTITVLGIAGFLVAERLDARSPAAATCGVVVFGIVAYLWGWRLARALAFPIGLFAFTLSLQQTLISPVAFWLQNVTANGAAALSHVIGLSIIQEGLVLRGDQFAFIVADTCSGMNSLLPLLTLAGVLLYIVRATPVGALGVLASVLPLVIVANTIRVESVLLVASRFGQEAAEGFFHGASSLVLFGLAFAGLLIVTRVARCRTIVAF